MDKPVRKLNRLPDFDYSSTGAYFVTLCTKNKECIFWDSVGAAIGRPCLSDKGKIVEWAIAEIPKRYEALSVDNYVVMPNHVHLLLRINADESGRPMAAPTISQVVSQMKAAVTKKIGQPVWQKLFHDHVVRGQADYLEIWEYIENNPAKWNEDRFYCV